MTQGNLFERRWPGALHAKADPVTSKLAAQEHVASGRNAAQKRAVLEYVRWLPDKTSLEMAAYAKERPFREHEDCDSAFLDRFAFARRLPDLEKAGLVMKSGARICAIGGRLSVTWRAR